MQQINRTSYLNNLKATATEFFNRNLRAIGAAFNNGVRQTTSDDYYDGLPIYSPTPAPTDESQGGENNGYGYYSNEGYIPNCNSEPEHALNLCPPSWVGDDYPDCESQQWGCDLTCYDVNASGEVFGGPGQVVAHPDGGDCPLQITPSPTPTDESQGGGDYGYGDYGYGNYGDYSDTPSPSPIESQGGGDYGYGDVPSPAPTDESQGGEDEVAPTPAPAPTMEEKAPSLPAPTLYLAPVPAPTRASLGHLRGSAESRNYNSDFSAGAIGFGLGALFLGIGIYITKRCFANKSQNRQSYVTPPGRLNFEMTTLTQPNSTTVEVTNSPLHGEI